MKGQVQLLLIAGVMLQLSTLLGQEIEMVQGREAASRQVLVKFNPGFEARLAQATAQQDIDHTRPVGRNGVVLLHSRTRDTNRLLQELRQRGDVQYAEPNYIVRANATPNDPFFSVLWGLRNTGQPILGVPGVPGSDIGAVSAWDISTGSSSIVVGVVDTGVDYGHQDLRPNMWSAPAPFTVIIGGVSINCPAGSHGYNAIIRSCNPMDDDGHGTHVSGTIGARGNNNVGVTGVNWITSIMGLKFLGNDGTGTTADAIDAIEFAIQTKAIFGAGANVRVLSNSWGGGDFSQSLRDEIDKAFGVDMLFVASAGNSARNNDLIAHYPSNYDVANVISVASIDNVDRLAVDSSYGRVTVDLGAPGVSVASTFPNDAYAIGSGTSMAAPHVSGAAALILSACPNLNTAALKQLLMTSVVPTSVLGGITVTGGRLNVNNAIRTCAGDFSLSATPSSQTVSRGSATSFTVNLTRIAGFTGAVTFTVTGLPDGAGGAFSPQPATGASSTLTITTNSTTPAGTFPLTITGTSGNLSHSSGTSLIVTAPPAGFPDLTIGKSHSGNFTQGQTGAAYTILVTNGGTGSTSGAVTVSDLLPAALSATAMSGTGWSCAVPAGTCTRSDVLAAGATYPAITLTVNVSSTAPASVTNTATVSGGGETDTANNTASDVTTILPGGGPSPLSIWPSSTLPAIPHQFDYPGTFGLKFRSDTAGHISGIRYYKGTTNNGIHTGLLYSATGTLLAQANFTGETASGWQQVNFPSVAISANTTYIAALWSSSGYALTSNFFAGRGVDNPPLRALQAGVDGPNGVYAYGATPSFPSAGFISANYWVDVLFGTSVIAPPLPPPQPPPLPEVAIAKSHTGNFTRGQIGATYTINVTNAGPGSTSGTVTVADTLPAGLTATAMSGSGWNCAQPAGPCTRTDVLTAGAAYPPITLTVNVSTTAPSTVTNTAIVSGGGDVTAGNNTANDPTSILAAGVPDLTITKTHSGNFTQGQAGATYSIVVSNSGNAPTSGMVTVTDILPSGLAATAIAGSGWSCMQPSGSCTRSGALAAGASYPPLTLTVNVSATAPATVTNTATVAGGGETNTSNNMASDVTTITPTGGGGAPTQSIWPASALPISPHQFDYPGTFGVKFRSDISGNINGIRFYKGAGNTGTHIGLLYSASGTLLAQATFTAETASGWQQVNFPSVPISANTTYVAAFWSSSGYALTNNYFTSSGFDNPPLRALRSGVDGPNGVSVYGNGPAFPSLGFVHANYWVDVVFSTGAVLPTPDLTITKRHTGSFTQGQSGATYTIVVTNGGTGATNGTVTVSDTLPSGLTATSIGGSGWNCVQPAGNCSRSDLLPAGASYPAITLTVDVSASAPASLTNTAAVSGGGDTSAGNNTATDPTTVLPAGGGGGGGGTPGKSILPPSAFPVNPHQFDYPGTFGMKFRSDVAGKITGIRFYKGPGNTGPHIGLLYSSTGTLLAQATFTGETASGWQQVDFPGVTISPNTTYVAAFWSATGYAFSNNYFATGVDNPPLRALASSAADPNGVSIYGPVPAFPNVGFNAANYWVDVVFVP
jgi:uncharacterized repeat protein (TIGR01451 family)